MRFNVLGTVQVISDGQVRPISELRRRLLAVLLVNANRPVSVETLVGALWETGVPQRPANSLQVHVHRLRQVLDRPERLRGVSGGYQLDVGPDELDAFGFAALHSSARNAVAAGDLERAVAYFRESLGLWRGAPYGDVAETQPVVPEANRLAETRLIASEELYDAELELGRAREIVPELTELVAAYPLRERIIGHLMLALYRSGRQSRAEVTYQTARQRLARDLKAAPGRELRELFESIRAEDPGLDIRPLATADDPGPMRQPAQLPPAPGAFLGREAEHAELDRTTATDGLGGLVVLTGMAGVGKTGLAVHYAHQVADRYGDGQLYLDLRGHSPDPALDPLEALGHLLRGLGAHRIPETVTDAVVEYRSLVAGRKMLVLLDNAGSTEQVRPLLSASSGSLTLITSRNRLSGLIAREGAHRISLGTLAADSARDLLVRLLGKQRIDAEPQHIANLVQACAGLPLALRIAAAQLADEPHRPVSDYLLELRERGLSVLALEDDKQSAVAAAFDLSYHHLEPGVRRVFRLAGLIPGLDFTVDAVAALSASSVADARAALRMLTGAHLLDEHAAGRYRFHDLLRSYAAQRAFTDETEDERAEALNRLYTWYYRGREVAADLLIAWRLEPPCPPLPDVPRVRLESRSEAIAWLKSEFQNIFAAIRDCADNGPAHWCWHLALGVVTDMERHGHAGEVLSMLDIVVAAARSAGDQHAIALSLGELGMIGSLAGRPMSSEEIDEMLTAAENSRDTAVSGFGLYVAGVVHGRSNDAPAAKDYLTRALDAQERSGDTTGQSLTLLHLGNAAFTEGDLRGAVDALERMVQLSGDQLPSLTIAGLLNVCHGRIALGRLDGIEDLLERGRQLAEQLQDDAWACVQAYTRASFYRDTGRVQEALDLLLAAGRRADELDLLRTRIHIRNELGYCHLALEDHVRARAEFEQAAELANSELLREFRTHAIRGLALADLAESSLVAAESGARDALELAAGADRLHEGEALVVLARVQLALGDPNAAIEYGEQALAIQRETGYLLGTARAHCVLGEARSDPDHLTEALRMFEAFGSPEATAVRDALNRMNEAPTRDGRDRVRPDPRTAVDR